MHGVLNKDDMLILKVMFAEADDDHSNTIDGKEFKLLVKKVVRRS